MDYDWVMDYGDEKFPVNARLLHGALGSRQQFGNWIKNRIAGGKFVENVDYILLHNGVEQDSWGGSNRVDYHTTTDAAMQLCQMEMTPKGTEVRMFLIARHKRLARVDAGAELPASMAGIKVPTTHGEALKMAATVMLEKESLAKKNSALVACTKELASAVEELKPRADWEQTVCDSDGLLT